MLLEFLLSLLLVGIYSICVFGYHIRYNPLFIDYVFETGNYMMLWLPLHHRPIKNDYSPYQIVGFCSYIAPQYIIAIYLYKSYRKEGRFLDLLYKYKGYVCTNNMKMVKTLETHGYIPIINIPYIRIFRANY